MKNTRDVLVVDRLQDSHQWAVRGLGRYPVPIRQVKLVWDGRNEPVLTRYHEDGEDYLVHNWSRADGQTDRYADVLLEAEGNLLNPGLADERASYEATRVALLRMKDAP